MLHIGVFNALLALTCWYAWKEGGQPEKLAAFGMAVGCIATFLLPFDLGRSYHAPEIGELIIDLSVLVWFAGIAAFANRFWPMWLAAVHLLAIGVHGVRAYQPDLLASIYAFAVGKAAYPMLALLVVGTARHRDRLQRHGSERDWSFVGMAT